MKKLIGQGDEEFIYTRNEHEDAGRVVTRGHFKTEQSGPANIIM